MSEDALERFDRYIKVVAPNDRVPQLRSMANAWQLEREAANELAAKAGSLEMGQARERRRAERAEKGLSDARTSNESLRMKVSELKRGDARTETLNERMDSLKTELNATVVASIGLQTELRQENARLKAQLQADEHLAKMRDVPYEYRRALAAKDEEIERLRAKAEMTDDLMRRLRSMVELLPAKEEDDDV